MALPERGTARARVVRGEAEKLIDLENAINATLEELEAAGHVVRDAQFLPPASNVRTVSAFIVYNDEVGLNADYGARHSAFLAEANRRAAERATANMTEAQKQQLDKPVQEGFERLTRQQSE